MFETHIVSTVSSLGNVSVYNSHDIAVTGPSIIFTRHHAAGKTRIRGGKLCQKVIGLDSNALYLYCIGQPLPEGISVRRRADNDFKPEYRDQYMQAFNWLNYLNEHEGTHIQHQRNRGKEVRFGRYPVDGYDPETNTVYEFQVSVKTSLPARTFH